GDLEGEPPWHRPQRRQGRMGEGLVAHDVADPEAELLREILADEEAGVTRVAGTTGPREPIQRTRDHPRREIGDPGLALGQDPAEARAIALARSLEEARVERVRRRPEDVRDLLGLERDLAPAGDASGQPIAVDEDMRLRAQDLGL